MSTGESLAPRTATETLASSGGAGDGPLVEVRDLRVLAAASMVAA